jgi:hypothetical protein
VVLAPALAPGLAPLPQQPQVSNEAEVDLPSVTILP